MKITIKDVAKKAQVSPSTVSRVISGNSRISEETRRKVNEVMKELDYHPNEIARSLVNKETRTIGVIMPKLAYLSLANPFFPEALRGISTIASEKGYYLLLSVESGGTGDNMGLEKMVRAGKVDGIVMMYSKMEDEILEFLNTSRFPFVVMGKPVNAMGISYVDNDNVSAAYEAVNCFIEKGRKNIALITGPMNFLVSLDRLEGYKRALSVSKLPYRKELVRETDYTKEAGFEAMMKFLELPNPPDAVLAADDILALGAINAIKDKKLKIPKDIGIIGFNNIPAAEFLNPSLSSVDVNPFELGYEAAELLLQYLEQNKHTRQARIIPTRLIERESS